MERIPCSREKALAPFEVVRFFDRAKIPCPPELQREAAKTHFAQQVRYSIELPAHATTSLSIVETDHQSVRRQPNGHLAVTVRDHRRSGKMRLPYLGDDKDILAALKPTSHIQSDDPRIVALSHEAIAGDEEEYASWLALLIEDFVRDFLSYEENGARLSAAEVARSRRGDCTEYAALAAALCRAVGLPARLVIGLVYSGEDGCFCYHEWVETYLGERWVGLDATSFPGLSPGYIALEILTDDECHNWALWSTFVDACRFVEIAPGEHRPSQVER
jgi:transglutaminase-like putative cysteine protease